MKRSAITVAVLERMQTIRKTNGYLTDAGTNAEKDRTDPMDDSEGFLIDVVAGSWEAEDQGTNVRRWMNLSVAFACQGKGAIETCEDITKDVVKAIYSDVTFGGLAILTEETGGASDKDTTEQLYAWGEVDVRILYATELGEI